MERPSRAAVHLLGVSSPVPFLGSLGLGMNEIFFFPVFKRVSGAWRNGSAQVKSTGCIAGRSGARL